MSIYELEFVFIIGLISREGLRSLAEKGENLGDNK